MIGEGALKYSPPSREPVLQYFKNLVPALDTLKILYSVDFIECPEFLIPLNEIANRYSPSTCAFIENTHIK